MSAHLLVVAKAPIPGFSKTRLAAVVGDVAAAELAADALLDTLTAGAAAFPDGHRHVAMAGDLADGVRTGEIRAALGEWTVRPQLEGTFGERLARAHSEVPGPVVQVGMDTPQVTPEDLLAVSRGLEADDAVLGPADDGGWWVLGLRDPDHAGCLVDVPMSTSQTGDATREALVARGLTVGSVRELRDVDTDVDAAEVAGQHPHLAFSRRWSTSGVQA